MTLPLTKLANIQSDLSLLQEELKVVEQYFTLADPQHESRKWEYAMAIRALDAWLDTRKGIGVAGHVIDVGGAGSPFWKMIGDSTIVVDPKDQGTLAEYLLSAPRLSHAVFCLSVLEHVDDLDRFCYHLGCLVAPGGLLFLTMDHGTDLPDQYHFHWDRKRIFDTKAWEQIREKCGEFELFGGRDRTYHGNQVYDFSIASLALIKRA